MADGLDDDDMTYGSSKEPSSATAPPIPPDFVCPLSMEIMFDPVIVATGQTYENVYIQRWLDLGHRTCPKTRKILDHINLCPNLALKSSIEDWCDTYNVGLTPPVPPLVVGIGKGGGTKDELLGHQVPLRNDELEEDDEEVEQDGPGSASVPPSRAVQRKSSLPDHHTDMDDEEVAEGADKLGRLEDAQMYTMQRQQPRRMRPSSIFSKMVTDDGVDREDEDGLGPLRMARPRTADARSQGRSNGLFSHDDGSEMGDIAEELGHMELKARRRTTGPWRQASFSEGCMKYDGSEDLKGPLFDGSPSTRGLGRGGGRGGRGGGQGPGREDFGLRGNETQRPGRRSGGLMRAMSDAAQLQRPSTAYSEFGRSSMQPLTELSPLERPSTAHGRFAASEGMNFEMLGIEDRPKSRRGRSGRPARTLSELPLEFLAAAPSPSKGSAFGRSEEGNGGQWSKDDGLDASGHGSMAAMIMESWEQRAQFAQMNKGPEEKLFRMEANRGASARGGRGGLARSGGGGTGLGRMTSMPAEGLSALVRPSTSSGPRRGGVSSALEGWEREMRPLVAMLRDGTPAAKEEAASVIRTALKDSQENKGRLVGAGGVHPLVELLQADNPVTVEHAVNCILSLSHAWDAALEIVAAGGFRGLVHVLNEGTDVAKGNAAAALFVLTGSDDNKLLAWGAGAVPSLVALLSSENVRSRKDASLALFHLAQNPRCASDIVMEGAIPVLLSLIRHPGLVEKSMAVLSNLADVPVGRTAIVNGGGVASAVAVLESGTNRAKEDAAGLLLQLTTSESIHINDLLSEGILTLLSNPSGAGDTFPGLGPNARSLFDLVQEHCSLLNAGRGHREDDDDDDED